MTCEDVRKAAVDLALGDLDAEPTADVRRHLESCAACRREAQSSARVVGLLRAAPAAAPSTERREAAVQAMAGAHGALAEAALVRPRRRWLGAAAAGLAAAAAGAWALRPSAPEFRAAEVAGGADVYRAAKGRWAPLSAGDVVAAGDRVVVHRGSTARLETAGASVELDGETSMGLTRDGRVALERGRIRADVRGGSMILLDTANCSATLRPGRFEAGLREVRGQVAGARETKEGGAARPAPRDVVSGRLFVRVAEGEADLGGSYQQRLRVVAGQEGSFDLGGQPEIRME